MLDVLWQMKRDAAGAQVSHELPDVVGHVSTRRFMVCFLD
jgi:hypothetical protein